MSKKLTQEQFLERCAETQEVEYDYSEAVYLGRAVDVKIICTKHNVTFSQPAGLHMAGQTSCWECVTEKKFKSRLEKRAKATPKGFKVCKTCSETLPHSAFLPNKNGADGFYSVCKKCVSKRASDARKDPEKGAKIKELSAKYARDNKDKCNVKSALRRAKRLNATHKTDDSEWEDFFQKEIYHLAKLREGTTKIKWHVDHQVPLTSDTVCGLHYSTNLQLIPAVVNLAKHNHYLPDMPLQCDELLAMIASFKQTQGELNA